ncbi:hypothetical protein CH373_07170 [Leptospira perolatii]|uniref:Uncharacterized protein n=1 Tax=Leptospira perolatii TaxID=2023191 RepID=A0A2M9ZPQ6_9LEPT|nr:hypothetical protein [Leptospira perolatii]PJZ70703.1 hypothetical protein CH360_04030 [Leptospira perolatii]PJZ73913.1 hypothetical protein CH373_07170 [Leptospira perolatii]
MSRLRILFLFSLVCAAAFLFWAWWKFSHPPEIKPAHYFTNDGYMIRFSPDSEFVKGIVSESAKPSPREDRTHFHSVGQIILLVDRSGALIGPQRSLVHLDPELSEKFGLSKTNAKIDTAFGIVDVPKEHSNQMRINADLEIAIYGLRKASANAKIVKIQRSFSSANSITILFRINEGKDWYPGTNCEVNFPEITSKPTVVPARSIVHFQKLDHVFIEWSKGVYAPRIVTVLEENDQTFSVLGVNPGEKVVSKGAILLQPLLNMTKSEEENSW